MAALKPDDLRAFIRGILDFPRPGVLFRDITPLLADARAFSSTIGMLAARIAAYEPHGIVAIESRGFIFGSALSLQMQLPLHLVRKQGKLPGKSISISYQLEYGSDCVEMHADAIQVGSSYAIVDDLIATGGTAAAASELIELQRGSVACCAFLIELDFLKGRQRLGGRAIESLLRY